MVVSVLSYVVKVYVACPISISLAINPKDGSKSSRDKPTVVFSTRTDTFLTVSGTDELGKFRLGVCGPQEERLVLVHTL